MLFRISGVDSRGLKTLIKPTTLSPFWKWKWRSSKKSKINSSKTSVWKTTKNSQRVGILKWQDAPRVNKAGVGSKLSKNNKSHHYSLRILHWWLSSVRFKYKPGYKLCNISLRRKGIDVLNLYGFASIIPIWPSNKVIIEHVTCYKFNPLIAHRCVLPVSFPLDLLPWQ